MKGIAVGSNKVFKFKSKTNGPGHAVTFHSRGRKSYVSCTCKGGTSGSFVSTGRCWAAKSVFQQMKIN